VFLPKNVKSGKRVRHTNIEENLTRPVTVRVKMSIESKTETRDWKDKWKHKKFHHAEVLD
jgi:hypothetical protein